MLKVYKKASPVILALLLIWKVISYIMFPELFYNNKMSYGACLHAISSDVIYSIEIDKDSDFAIVTLQDSGGYDEDDAERKYIVECIGINGSSCLIRQAEGKGVEIIEANHRIFSSLRIAKLLIIVGIVVGIYNVYQRKRKTPSVVTVGGKSSSTGKIQDTKITFEDVAGLDEEKFELMEIVDFLKDPDRYTKLGAKIPRGVLLDGKPGTGKTLLAKAVAGEAGVSFISSSGSGFINKYIGVGADNIRKLFEKARQEAPCIVFIDEIDAIGGKRLGENSEANGERNQTIDQLLTELDGFQTRDNIIIFAATNNPEVLDSALTRPGRFDRTIHIGLPDVRGRKAILEVHSRNKPLFEDVSLESIAKNTAGFSGAQLENLLNEAAIHAVRNQHKAISKEDVQEAFRKITVGLKKSYIMSEEEKRLIAAHESGHAIVNLFMSTQPNVKEVSIIPHNTVGGYTWNDTTDDKNYSSKTELMEKLTVLMAGRVAENIIIGDVSTGASKDIEIATEIATKMVSTYGMDLSIGPISVGSIHSGEYLLSEKTLSNIDDKIFETIKEAEKSAEQLITFHRELIEEVIKILLEQETISGEELQQIYNKYNSKCAN